MKKKILLVLSTVVICMIALGVNVSAGNYGDLTYTVSNGEITITDGYTTDIFVEIPEMIEGKPVTQIGSYAFSDCVNLKSVIIPGSVIKIGTGAFCNCESLTDINISDGVTYIGRDAFSECTSLESIIIPDSVTFLGDAFFGCTNLKRVDLSANLTRIRDMTFFACTNLTTVTIPASVTEIEGDAFYECENLKRIYYYGTEEQWEEMDKGGSYLLTRLVRFVSTRTTVSSDGKVFTIKPVNVEEGEKVIIALYNNGVFAEIQTATCMGENITFTATKDYTDAKIMAWKNLLDIKPISDAEEI